MFLRFLHVPFVSQNMSEATQLVQRLIVLLRNWGAGSGYVVLVTWEDEQDNVKTGVASALMRAGIPRVCAFGLDRRLAVHPSSLLSGSNQGSQNESPRSARRWKKSIRRSLSNTNGPLVF